MPSARDGARWLFLSRRRPGAAAAPTASPPPGAVEHVYDPWRYPEDWVVETFAPEGPKIVRRGDFYYLTTAVGGTAGPPTGHMVIMARSRSLDGPWENHPGNPIIRTAVGAREMVVARPRHLVRRPGRPLVDDLSRL